MNMRLFETVKMLKKEIRGKKKDFYGSRPAHGCALKEVHRKGAQIFWLLLQGLIDEFLDCSVQLGMVPDISFVFNPEVVKLVFLDLCRIQCVLRARHVAL